MTITKKVKPDPICMIVTSSALNKWLRGATVEAVENGAIKLRSPVGDTYVVSSSSGGSKWDVELYDIKREGRPQ